MSLKKCLWLSCSLLGGAAATSDVLSVAVTSCCHKWCGLYFQNNHHCCPGMVLDQQSANLTKSWFRSPRQKSSCISKPTDCSMTHTFFWLYWLKRWKKFLVKTFIGIFAFVNVNWTSWKCATIYHSWHSCMFASSCSWFEENPQPFILTGPKPSAVPPWGLD